MDAGLAKALNSSIGTSDFKSLDKIFEDGMRLVASEDVIYKYDGAFTTRYAGYGDWRTTADSYITFDKPGTVYIKTEQYLYASGETSKPGSAKIMVLNESGDVIAEMPDNVMPKVDGTVTIYMEMNVVPGTKYRVALKCSNGENWGAYLAGNFSVCGKTVLFGANVTKVS